MSITLSEKHAAILGVLDRLARMGRRILEEQNRQQVTTACDDPVALKAISDAEARWNYAPLPNSASQDATSGKLGDSAN